MKFHELKVGDRFKLNNEDHTKLQEVKISCCKIKHNAEKADGSKVIIAPLQEVEKLETN